MRTITTTRGAQPVLSAAFAFNFDDVANDVNGVAKDFGKTAAGAVVFVAFELPIGAVVVGGDVTTFDAFSGGTVKVKLGDVADPVRYLAETDRKAVGKSALTANGLPAEPGGVLLSVEPSAAQTAGRMVARLEYVVPDRETVFAH